jgi:DNA relaxase NicK
MQLECLVDPVSNTGLNSQVAFTRPLSLDRDPTFGIDALVLLWDEINVDVLGLLYDTLGVQFDLTKSYPMVVGVKWESVFRTVKGSLYMIRPTENGNRYRLALSGKECSSIPLDLMCRFCEIIKSQIVSIECSRIDVRLDDFRRTLTRDKICAALEAGSYSGFQKWQLINNGGREKGWTINLGSRQSSAFTRIYDKFWESKGEIPSIRIETEYKNEKAQSIFDCVSSARTVIESQRYLHGLVLGKVNFIDRLDKNLERCSMLTWWAEFLGGIGFERCQVIVEKSKPSVEKTKNWIEKQVEKSLALLSRVFGEDSFSEYIKERVLCGSRRLNRMDELSMLEYLQASLA